MTSDTSSEATFTRKVLSSGRITIPKLEVDRLELKQGDLVQVTVRKELRKAGK